VAAFECHGADPVAAQQSGSSLAEFSAFQADQDGRRRPVPGDQFFDFQERVAKRGRHQPGIVFEILVGADIDEEWCIGGADEPGQLRDGDCCR
jgi:hypothetical protein